MKRPAPRRYSLEIRAKAVRQVVEHGFKPLAVAAELDTSVSNVRRWLYMAGYHATKPGSNALWVPKPHTPTPET